MSFKNQITYLPALLLLAVSSSLNAAQVTGQVTVAAANGTARPAGDARVVVWLTPLDGPAVSRATPPSASPHPRLVQKNKVFSPHLLAVQVGSQVDFPNHDPFFHNVFSLFNGKRFDLGLYEAGSTRGVHFDRVGICYIFCNIHPQMSAVIVVVGTPYFGVSDSRGEFRLSPVPSGPYRLNVWEEHCTAKTLEELSRDVTVGAERSSLGSIRFQETEQPVMAHTNKYGKPYDPEVFQGPLYGNP